jgi:hypothetical protein
VAYPATATLSPSSSTLVATTLQSPPRSVGQLYPTESPTTGERERERTPRQSMESTSTGAAHGIGDFMLNGDPGSGFTSPVKSAFPTGSAMSGPGGPATPMRTLRTAMDQEKDLPVSPTAMHMAGSSSVAPQLDELDVVTPSAEISLQQALDNVDPRPVSLPAPVTTDLPARRESLQSIGLGHPISPPRFTSTPTPTSPSLSVSNKDSPVRARGHARIRSLKSRPVGLDEEANLTAADGADDEEMEVLARTPRNAVPEQGIVPGSPHSRGSGTSIDEKSLPPLPNSAPILDARGQPIVSNRHSRQTSGGSRSVLGQLISSSTLGGTISQRRLSRNMPTTSITSLSEIDGLPTSKRSSGSEGFPSSTSTSGFSSKSSITATMGSTAGFSFGKRTRSRSQPGDRPDFADAQAEGGVPPLPTLRNKASFASQRGGRVGDGLTGPMPGGALAPPFTLNELTPRSMYPAGDASAGSLISPVPEPQPAEVPLRPFHVLRLLYSSMDPSGPGEYLTSSVHIAPAVWRPANWTKANGKAPAPKIFAQDVKVRCIEQLLLHLPPIRQAGSLFLDGPREASYGRSTSTSTSAGDAGPGGSGITKSEVAGMADRLMSELEAVDEEMEAVYKALVKAGVNVGGWKGRKVGDSSSWRSRMAQRMDKIGGRDKA